MLAAHWSHLRSFKNCEVLGPTPQLLHSYLIGVGCSLGIVVFFKALGDANTM